MNLRNSNHTNGRVGDRFKRENLYTCIVMCWEQCSNITYTGKKFHNVDADKPAVWQRFLHFVRKDFPNASHINIYGGISRNFIRQEKLKA
jgi:hypothetical protein